MFYLMKQSLGTIIVLFMEQTGWKQEDITVLMTGETLIAGLAAEH